MTPPLTSPGLTEKKPVLAVTAVVTERSLTIVSHGFPQAWNWAVVALHVKLQLFQPYQSPESAVKYT